MGRSTDVLAALGTPRHQGRETWHTTETPPPDQCLGAGDHSSPAGGGSPSCGSHRPEVETAVLAYTTTKARSHHPEVGTAVLAYKTTKARSHRPKVGTAVLAYKTAKARSHRPEVGTAVLAYKTTKHKSKLEISIKIFVQHT